MGQGREHNGGLGRAGGAVVASPCRWCRSDINYGESVLFSWLGTRYEGGKEGEREKERDI